MLPYPLTARGHMHMLISMPTLLLTARGLVYVSPRVRYMGALLLEVLGSEFRIVEVKSM